MTDALVTGGAGFLGRRLALRLLRDGASVRVLDLAPKPAPDKAFDALSAPTLEWVQGSVADPEIVAEAMSGVEEVYHLAAVADLWSPDPSIFETVNVDGTRIVLDAARRAGAKRFLLCSSATTLIADETPIGPSTVDETAEWSPEKLLGAYPRSKRRAELETLAAANDGFHAVVVNPTEPAGAGDFAITPPTRMMLDFINGKTPAFIDCVLNFVPVDSLAEGAVRAARQGASGERYILGGDNTSMRDLLRTLERLSGRKTPTLKLPYAIAALVGLIDTGLVARATGKPPKAPLTGVRLAGRRAAFSSEKARRAFDWTAGPYEPAIAELIDWAREQDLIKGE